MQAFVYSTLFNTHSHTQVPSRPSPQIDRHGPIRLPIQPRPPIRPHPQRLGIRLRLGRKLIPAGLGHKPVLARAATAALPSVPDAAAVGLGAPERHVPAEAALGGAEDAAGAQEDLVVDEGALVPRHVGEGGGLVVAEEVALQKDGGAVLGGLGAEAAHVGVAGGEARGEVDDALVVVALVTIVVVGVMRAGGGGGGGWERGEALQVAQEIRGLVGVAGEGARGDGVLLSAQVHAEEAARAVGVGGGVGGGRGGGGEGDVVARGEGPEDGGGEGAGVVAGAEQAAKVVAEAGPVGGGGPDELGVGQDVHAHGVAAGGRGGELLVHEGEELGAEDARVGDDRGLHAVEDDGGDGLGGVEGELREGDGEGLEEGGLVVEGVEGGVDLELGAVRGEGVDEVGGAEHVLHVDALALLAAAQLGDVGRGAGVHPGENELC